MTMICREGNPSSVQLGDFFEPSSCVNRTRTFFSNVPILHSEGVKESTSLMTELTEAGPQDAAEFFQITCMC